MATHLRGSLFEISGFVIIFFSPKIKKELTPTQKRRPLNNPNQGPCFSFFIRFPSWIPKKIHNLGGPLWSTCKTEPEKKEQIKTEISWSFHSPWGVCFCLLQKWSLRTKRRIFSLTDDPWLFLVADPCSNGSVLVNTTTFAKTTSKNLVFPFQLDDDPILPWTKVWSTWISWLFLFTYIHPIPSTSMKIWVQDESQVLV